MNIKRLRSKFVAINAVILILFLMLVNLVGLMVSPEAYAAGPYYWVGGSGNWEDSTHWASSSGGAGGAGVPTLSDDVYFDTNSGSGFTVTVTAYSSSRCHGMDWTGAQGSPVFKGNPTSPIRSFEIYGDCILSGMTIGDGVSLNFRPSATNTLTTNGIAIPLMTTGHHELVLQDSLTVSASWLIMLGGTFTTNNQSVSSSFINMQFSPTVNLGSSTINCLQWVWETAGYLNAGTSTIKLAGRCFRFWGGSQTYYNVEINGDWTGVAFTGSNTFNNLQLGAGLSTLNMEAGSTQRVTTMTRDGGIGIKKLQSGGAWNLVKVGGGTITMDYLNISYSNASPANTWYAGSHCNNKGNNIGWEWPIGFGDVALDTKMHTATGADPIYTADIEALTAFEGNNLGIANLSGMDVCINLSTLYLSNNSITNVSPLSGLSNLRCLNLSENNIDGNISALLGLTGLTCLRLGGNEIDDVSPLSGLVNLSTLILSDNNISDVSPLSGLVNLSTLDLSDNDISDISPLSGLIGLDWLDLSNNSVSDIQPLVDNPGIGGTIILDNNPLDAPSYYEGIPELEDRGVTVTYEGVLAPKLMIQPNINVMMTIQALIFMLGGIIGILALFTKGDVFSTGVRLGLLIGLTVLTIIGVAMLESIIVAVKWM